MIKANELRIGNWLSVQYPDGIIGSVQISFIDNEDIEEYEPIPLTPEILEKCDRIPLVYNKEYFIKSNPSFSIFYNSRKWQLKHSENELPVFIEYLHQLQNLYFALTGTELEINI